MSLWLIISTVATILGAILGIARWIAAVRKAKVDRELGAVKTENEGLKNAVEAAEQRAEVHSNVVRLPDRDADKRLDKWMRD